MAKKIGRLRPYILTAKFIKSLVPPAKGNYVRFDSLVSGLGIRIMAGNVRRRTL